ncbi:conserved hypothetical protein [Nitrosococcus halophilus Nc 4]|uniref:Uncharacterized protein n=1 Tax=Nitrosococcus halophilus (strain Nc4) TaxID=472759 RepID=D5C332_NITHN|nr:hypothetical protein [Nitrosococcus halophilus]ADE14924.1 conserved hypothetical protein [Nitrosococcus halophilus Nc 4]
MANHKISSPNTLIRGLTHLQATASCLMSRYTHHSCPHLASAIVHHLHLLSEHPLVQNDSESRKAYLHLLEYWQRRTGRNWHSHESLLSVGVKSRRH